MQTGRCDTCGAVVTDKSANGVKMYLRPGLTGNAPQKKPRSLADLVGMPGDAPRYENETFDLCDECALGLLVALKHKQLLVTKHGSVEEN